MKPKLFEGDLDKFLAGAKRKPGSPFVRDGNTRFRLSVGIVHVEELTPSDRRSVFKPDHKGIDRLLKVRLFHCKGAKKALVREPCLHQRDFLQRNRCELHVDASILKVTAEQERRAP